jgi:hypothetical protein
MSAMHKNMRQLNMPLGENVPISSPFLPSNVLVIKGKNGEEIVVKPCDIKIMKEIFIQTAEETLYRLVNERKRLSLQQ